MMRLKFCIIQIVQSMRFPSSPSENQLFSIRIRFIVLFSPVFVLQHVKKSCFWIGFWNCQIQTFFYSPEHFNVFTAPAPEIVALEDSYFQIAKKHKKNEKTRKN